jgi:hypothetical protein
VSYLTTLYVTKIYNIKLSEGREALALLSFNGNKLNSIKNFTPFIRVSKILIVVYYTKKKRKVEFPET